MVTLKQISEQNNTMGIILFVLVVTYILFQTSLGLIEAVSLTQYTDLDLDKKDVDLFCKDVWIGYVIGSMFDLLVPLISGISVIVTITLYTYFRKKILLKNILISMTAPQIIQFVYAFWSIGSFESTVRLCGDVLNNTAPQLWAAILVHFFASCIVIIFGTGVVGYQCIKLQNSKFMHCYRKKHHSSVEMTVFERSIVL